MFSYGAKGPHLVTKKKKSLCIIVIHSMLLTQEIFVELPGAGVLIPRVDDATWLKRGYVAQINGALQNQLGASGSVRMSTFSSFLITSP